MKTIIMISSVALLAILSSCGEYEKLAIEKESQRVADSLFREHRDSLNKAGDSLCRLNYDSYYNAAVDSIKETQLVKIKKLMGK